MLVFFALLSIWSLLQQVQGRASLQTRPKVVTLTCNSSRGLNKWRLVSVIKYKRNVRNALSYRSDAAVRLSPAVTNIHDATSLLQRHLVALNCAVNFGFQVRVAAKLARVLRHGCSV